jgi:hypothetical protein
MADDTVYAVIDTVDTNAGSPTSAFYEKNGVVTGTSTAPPDDTVVTYTDGLDTTAGSPNSSFYEKGTIYQAIDLATNVLTDVQTAATSAAASAAAAAASYAANVAALSAYAPLASPGFSGAPTAPTPPNADNSTRIPTTAWVLLNAPVTPPATATPIVDGTGAVGVATKYAREDHVHPTDASRAALASPALTGTPTVPTAAALNNTTQVASTAYADAAVSTLSGTVTTALALKAPLTSPALSGVPTAPTAAVSTNTTQLATTAFVLANSSAGGRPQLAANRTYYVLTTGSDSNTGLVNTAGGAFLTIQKAINVTSGLDLNGFNTTIQVGAGTYAGTISVLGPFIGGGATGTVSLLGDTTTPTNVILSNGISVGNAAVLTMGGFKTTAVISVSNYGVLNITGKMDIGASGSQHFNVYYGGVCNITAGYTISGDASIHWLVKQSGRITCTNVPITVTGRTFSSLFAYASQGGGILEVNGITWTGTFTGQRYQAEYSGGIITGGGGVNYFPGSIAGVTNSPGWYQ